MSKIKITHWPSGQTTAFQDGEQVPFLQRSWLVTWAMWMGQHGVDVTKEDVEVEVDGRRVRIFKTEHGFNWEQL